MNQRNQAPKQTYRYEITPCKCGSEKFDLQYGEPITCSNCGAIPENLKDKSLEEPYSHLLIVNAADHTTSYYISQQEF